MRALVRLAAWWGLVFVCVSLFAVLFQLLLPVGELVSTVLGFAAGFTTVVVGTLMDLDRHLRTWAQRARGEA
jgi:hypothetical protein